MNLHEYQSKSLFRAAGIPVPEGEAVASAAEARAVAERVGLPVAVKAQVQVAGRGKAGGIKIAATPEEAESQAEAILAMTIKGLPVRKVLVERASRPAAEAYLAVTIDRAQRKPVIVSSPAGGVDIEQVARETPEKISRTLVDPLLGLRSFQARAAAAPLFQESLSRSAGLQPCPGRPKGLRYTAGAEPPASQAAAILTNLYNLFMEKDLSLAEINPLVLTEEGKVVALDAKIIVDDNALFRRPELAQMRDVEAEDPREVEARNNDLSYVRLDGSLGCMVNGAGLAMATMDLIKWHGGEPANFLDVGGSSSPQKVLAAMRILLSDPKVKAILVNIFGGITRCDDIANGLVQAIGELKVQIPIVARLTGTNEAKGREILQAINVQTAETMEKAVQRAVEMAGG
jgi:succinyl-CoA synthetase beta subunit